MDEKEFVEVALIGDIEEVLKKDISPEWKISIIKDLVRKLKSKYEYLMEMKDQDEKK